MIEFILMQEGRGFIEEISLYEQTIFQEDALSKQQLLSILDKSLDEYFILMLQDKRLVGYLYAIEISSNQTLDLMKLVILKEFRQQGLGFQLLQYLESIKHIKDNIQQILLEVRVSNNSAISLYKKGGYQELGIRKKFYKHPQEDALILKKKINQKRLEG